MGVPPNSTPAIMSPDFEDSIGDITNAQGWNIGVQVPCGIEGSVPGKPSIGDGLFRIKPDAPNYARALAYIGPMRPGDDKPMPRLDPNGKAHTLWD